MVTTDAELETPTVTPDSAADLTPGSDETPASPDAGLEDQGAPAQEPAPTEPTPPADPSQDFQSLQQRYDTWRSDPEKSDPLSTEERSRLGRYQTQVESQRNARLQARQQQAKAAQDLQSLNDGFGDRLLGHVKQELDSATQEMRSPSETLLKRYVDDEKEALFKEATPLVTQPYKAALLEAIYQLDGETQATLEKITDLQGEPLDNVMLAYRDSVFSAGQRLSPDGKKVTALETENANLKAELEKLKKAGGSGPSTNGREGSTSGKPTYEQIQKMTPEQVKALPEGTVYRATYGG